MSRSPLPAAVAALTLCVASAGTLASQAISAGGLTTDVGNVSSVGASSIGDICVGANVAGPAGVGGFAGSNSAALPVKACTIAIATPGFPGVVPGFGFLKVPKTPNQSSSGTINAMAAGTSATGHANWTEKNVPGSLPPGVDFMVTGNATANVVGPVAGLAAGKSDDPMFFSLDASAIVTLSVTLTEDDLEALADPGATAAAFLAATFAIGGGDTPGSDVLQTNSVLDTLKPGDSFMPHSVTLFDDALALPAGDYWLTDSLTAGGLITSVPETPVVALMLLGLGALAMARRQTTGTGPRR